MRSAPAFKKRYAMLIGLLLLAGLIFYRLMHVSPLEESVVQKVKVNNLANLYVTEANAGATTPFSYRFYLYDAGKTDNEFRIQLREQVPFFITEDRHALKDIVNGVIYLSTREKIYKFSNHPAYRYNNAIYEATVNLSATSNAN